MNRKICIVTGSRAEYGLLFRLMKEIDNDPALDLQVIVTGMHLSHEFGSTSQQIEKDGFKIDKKIEMLLSSDTAIGVCKSMGLATISFPEAYIDLNPDIVVLLGDRFETFCAASTAHVSRIPIAHIHGGEITSGIMDEAFRHSITKMSQLHFTSTEEYRKRVIQLGENPDRVFNVGALSIENIRKLKLLGLKELEDAINFSIGEKAILVTFHPVTLEKNTSEEQFQNLIEAIDEFPNLRIIFTKANADTEGRIINKKIDAYVKKNPNNSVAFTSMGQIRYLSAMKHVNAVVGNSSSGIVEAPSFSVPTLNIGDRQKGRVRAPSIIDCFSNEESILSGLKRVLSQDFKQSTKGVTNPHEKEKAAYHIKEIIKNTCLNNILKKYFHDLKTV